MNISLQAIASSTDMMKNYRSCRQKAQSMGKLFILKNNQADAVLFSIKEYEKLSAIIEHFEKYGRNVTIDDIKGLKQNVNPKIQPKQREEKETFEAGSAVLSW